MSHVFEHQNEAPQADGRSDGTDIGTDIDQTFRTPSPRAGGFFSDVVWIERRQDDDGPDSRDSRDAR
jgi:hypothetical protein